MIRPGSTMIGCFCLVIYWIQYATAELTSIPPYELNVMPTNLPELAPLPIVGNTTKHIPLKIWMAVKDVNDELPGHIKEFFKRNSHWDATVCDNDCKDKFMNTTFAGTSVAWAYSLVRAPPYFASKADIWRYAVMYTYGGMYLDDDSDIRRPLDQIVQPDDRLILSEEGPSSMGDCYVPTFHLSDTHTFFTYGHNASAAKHYNGVDTDGQHQFFHGNTIINWAMFAAPRHPVYKRALENVVEIVKSMYLRQSVVHITRWDVKFKTFFCTTVFVLTYSVRELELENALPAELMPRIERNNFMVYGGNVKAVSTQWDPSHYRQKLKHHAPPFLTESVPLDLAHYVQYLEGKSVMGDSGREILLIQKGTKRKFPDYDTFLKMEFTDRHTKHVSDDILKQIPVGPMIDKDEKIVSAYSKTHVHAVLAQQRNNPVHSGKRHQQSAHDKKVKAAFSGAEHQHVVSESNALVVEYLRNVSSAVNAGEMGCWGDDYGGTRDDYLKGQWEDVLKGVPTMVYPLCTGMFQLGNTLGYYLNDIACADISGAHFIAVHKTFALTQPELLVTHTPGAAVPFPPGTVATPATTRAMAEDARYTFFNHLPDLIAHSRPLEPAQVKANMKAECHCLQFCWENNQAPWLKRVPLIGRTLRPAIDAYVAASKAQSTGTILNPQTDKSTLPMGSFLPLLPNVTIQYRCGDNIGFGKSKYGLLPFSAYKNHRVPRDIAKYIYVIADSPQRSAAHVYSGRCETILQRLFAYLVKEHPQAVVVLKRGGDLFLDYARIAYSNVAVCSASTFCLWPALSNQHGQVHFPLTPLVARADTNLTAPNLAPNFHWISEVQMIKQFKHYRPWDRLIDDLETF